MKTLKTIALAAVACMSLGATAQNTVYEHEKNIKAQEQLVEDHEDDIKDLDKRIAVLKARVDSLNKATKKVKDQISDLEKLKKQHQTGIKEANKARKQSFESRDNLVFDQEIADVLTEPYNKAYVEDALKSFDGMETKDVLKRKNLVANYGEYTKNLREFLEKQKIVLAGNGWAPLNDKDEAYKKFMKGLKSTKYWKIYDKSTKSPSIPYLDNVMEQLMQQATYGLSDSRRFDEIINMLYNND